MRHDKLVRDRIPEIIERQGGHPSVRILDQEEYVHCLERKLDEEVEEYHRNKNPEELADILVVVYALANVIGCSKEELLRIYQQKHDARGGFEKRIFLVSSEK